MWFNFQAGEINQMCLLQNGQPSWRSGKRLEQWEVRGWTQGTHQYNCSHLAVPACDPSHPNFQVPTTLVTPSSPQNDTLQRSSLSPGRSETSVFTCTHTHITPSRTPIDYTHTYTYTHVHTCIYKHCVNSPKSPAMSTVQTSALTSPVPDGFYFSSQVTAALV